MRENKLFQNIVSYAIVIGVIIVATVAILYFTNQPKVKETPGKYADDIKENVLYKVVRVLDGDTLIANVAGHNVTLRLIGIDTPEVVDPRKPVQCYGPEASAEAKKLLSGKEIYIEKEKAKGNYDKYGRVLGYVHFSDGSLYNELMIKNGYAREYTYHKEKYKYQKQFKADQKIAQNEKIGLWEKCPATTATTTPNPAIAPSISF